MIIKNGLVYNSDGYFQKKDLYVYDGVITDDETSAASDRKIIDAQDKYVIPGLVDIHSHGAVGHDFCDASEDGLKEILKYERSCGITSYCPTSMTLSFDILKDIFSTACNISPSSEYAHICGINMEGPFISANKKGAQNGKYISAPDIDMFKKLMEQSDGLIKLVTLAPETENALDFIDQLKSEVHISIGHTDANYDQTCAAFEHGADHVTHICNAMPPFHHRDSGVIGAAVDNPNVFVEVICDGIHIHPSMIRSLFKLFGSDRIVLISDSMEATGMPDGDYELGKQKVVKHGNLATLEGGTLAGSATNLFDCMKKAVEFDIPLEDAVKCATANPAKSIGEFPTIGSLSTGSKADILILTKDLELEKII